MMRHDARVLSPIHPSMSCVVVPLQAFIDTAHRIYDNIKSGVIDVNNEVSCGSYWSF